MTQLNGYKQPNYGDTLFVRFREVFYLRAERLCGVPINTEKRRLKRFSQLVPAELAATADREAKRSPVTKMLAIFFVQEHFSIMMRRKGLAIESANTEVIPPV